MQPKFKGGYHCIVDDYTMIHIINYMRFMSFRFSFSHINRYKFLFWGERGVECLTFVPAKNLNNRAYFQIGYVI